MTVYPFIVTCRECGAHSVPVPLTDYPIGMAAFSRRLLEIAETTGCAGCGALRHNLVVDQSTAAQDWYDREVRGKETPGPDQTRETADATQ